MSDYTPERRSAAAAKGWEKRKKQLPEYDQSMQSIGNAGDGSTIDLAGELPVSSLFEAGGMANWPDPVYDIDPNGYRTIHTCLPVIESVEKRGIRIAKLNWTVIGDGKRADAIREIISQVRNWTDMIKWLNWADVDGVRFMQIKSAPARDGGEPYIVPDFFMGGRKKFKAGGDIQWDGRKLVRVQRTTGQATVETAKLPAWQFIIHRPGAGSNPEGDSNIGIATYRIAYSWEEALKNTDAYMELFGVPIRVFKGKMDKVRADQVSGLLQDRAARLKLLKTNKQLVLSDEEMLDLIEPKGQGFADMIEYARYLEGLLDQLFLANQLTSSVTESNRTGDTGVHLSEESEAIYAGAMQIAEALNRHLLPWIVRKNPNLPELADGEFEPYIWPEPPQEAEEDDSQDISVEDDGMATSDAATDEDEEPVASPEEDTLEAVPDTLDGLIEGEDEEATEEKQAIPRTRTLKPTTSDEQVLRAIRRQGGPLNDEQRRVYEDALRRTRTRVTDTRPSEPVLRDRPRTTISRPSAVPSPELPRSRSTPPDPRPTPSPGRPGELRGPKPEAERPISRRERDAGVVGDRTPGERKPIKFSRDSIWTQLTDTEKLLETAKVARSRRWIPDLPLDSLSKDELALLNKLVAERDAAVNPDNLPPDEPSTVPVRRGDVRGAITPENEDGGAKD